MKNKILSMLLSIVLAFGLWLYVVNVISTESNNTFSNIPVVFEGETLLNERGLMLTSGDTASVTATISGNRSDLSKISSSNLTARVDLTKVYDPGEHVLNSTIVYPSDVRAGALTADYKSTVKISVEKRIDNTVPVKIAWVGAVPDDYIADTNAALLDQFEIAVSGPASVVSQIDHARIDVDLSDRVESMSENYQYILCDKDGNPVDAALITTNVAEVHLDLRIQRLKEIPLKLNVNYGGGATESNTQITIEPKTIKVSGSDARLADLHEIVLGTVDLATIEKNELKFFPINLPEGITNVSSISEAQVDITFSGLSIKKFTVSQIEMVNIPEGMTYTLLNERLEVTLRGPTDRIAKLTADDIFVTVDLAGKEAGTMTVKATVTIRDEQYKSVGQLGSLSVSVTIRPLEDDKE